MNKVNKAIIMAAGTGNRLRPLTDGVPKPLISVNGKIMIEGLIETLLDRGVKDITVVVGYLREKCDYLKDKYGVKLIVNNDFAKANNIASLYYARKELNTGVVILDGDQIINDASIVKKRFLHSGYSCNYSRGRSAEWMLKLDDGCKIIACSRDGGQNAWELRSISYWSKADAQKLARLVEREYESGNNRIYWDDVAMFVCKDEFELYGHKIKKSAVTEIDSVSELISLDKSYGYLKEITIC